MSLRPNSSFVLAKCPGTFNGPPAREPTQCTTTCAGVPTVVSGCKVWRVGPRQLVRTRGRLSRHPQRVNGFSYSQPSSSPAQPRVILDAPFYSAAPAFNCHPWKQKWHLSLISRPAKLQQRPMVARSQSRTRPTTAASSPGSRSSMSSSFRIQSRRPFLTIHSRPKSLDDVAAQEHTVTVLQRTLQAANVRTRSKLRQAFY